MKSELINLIVTVGFTIVYMIAAMKTLLPFFYRISKPLTGATGILLAGVILGFGICLNNFSAIATSAFHFYEVKGKIVSGISTWFLFSVISFIFSYLVFLLSFNIINWTTQENEKAELAKNNYWLAVLHVVVFVIICLVVSQPLTDLANTFIDYQKFPN